MSVNDFSDNILLTGGEFEKEKNYWLENLQGGVTMAQFPADYNAVRIGPKNRAEIFYHLPDSLYQRLSSISNSSAYGLYMILLSGVVFLLHKLTSNRDIVVGMPVSKQNTREQFINNVLALRIKINPEASFKEFLLDIRNTVTEAHKNQNFPFRSIAGLLGIAPRSEGFPLINVLVSMRNVHDESCHHEIMANTGFIFEMNQKGLALNVEYNTDLYHGDTIRRLTGYLENFLHVVTQDPGVALSQICILSDRDINRIIHEFNDTFAEYDKIKVIHQLFEEQVKKTPQSTALVFEGGELSYETLNQKANQLAGLLRERGVLPGTPVAVLMDRSPEMIIAVLGILKAGGAYVPLEPGFPDGRIKNILKNLELSYIITQYPLLRRIQTIQWELEKLNEIVLMEIETRDMPLERINAPEVEALWDHVVGSSSDRVTAGGFKSSYTGEPFSEEEVNEYVNHVVNLAAPCAGSGKHVLEIGCGSGLIMFELAPNTESYTALDPSGTALEYVKKRAEELGYNIKPVKGFAHEIATMEQESYDLIILASTAQFFPGFLYLRKVMEEAVRILKPGGVLIVADNMDLHRKEEFQKSLEEFKRRQQGRQGVRTKTDLDNELYVPHEFYRELSMELATVKTVRVLYREKGFNNELGYRYDVIIQKARPGESVEKNSDAGVRKKYIWTAWHMQQYPTDDPPRISTSGDIAYIIHTSGSTGTPKGAVARHKPVINLIEWVNKTFTISAADRLLFITSLCFDLSVYDIFGMLAAGGSLRIVSGADIRNPQKLYEIMVSEPVTFWDSAPAALQQLVPFMGEDPERGSDSKLRLVFLSGDWIPVTLPGALRAEFPKVEVVSLGGATEATVWSNFYPVGRVDPSWPSIPYGKPIPNARYYILDSCLQPCPIGVPGDLYIGGECLAAGYINDPVLTSQKFVRDHFSDAPDGTMYKTGDLARWFPDGNMEFLGRGDFQVKIRGYRIELGEIESRLLKHDLIKEAVVVAKEDATGSKSLFSYIISDEKLTVAELREFLAGELPDYMIPSYFIQLEKMPVTPNGKLDRNALPGPGDRLLDTEAEYIAPRNGLEKTMAGIWENVLGIERIGIHDNFFEFGGDSIKAMKVVSMAKESNINIAVSDMIRYGTIAKVIENASLRDMEAEIRSHREKSLIEIWERVLGVRGITINDDFFEMGGGKFKAEEVVLAAQELNIPINVSVMARKRTIVNILMELSSGPAGAEIAAGAETADSADEPLPKGILNTPTRERLVRPDGYPGNFNLGFSPEKPIYYYDCFILPLLEKLRYENEYNMESSFLLAVNSDYLISCAFMKDLPKNPVFKNIPAQMAGYPDFNDFIGINTSLATFESLEMGLEYCREMLSKNKVMILRGCTYYLKHTPDYHQNGRILIDRINQNEAVRSILQSPFIPTLHTVVLFDITREGYWIFDSTFGYFGVVPAPEFHKFFEGLKAVEVLKDHPVYDKVVPFQYFDINAANLKSPDRSSLALNLLKLNVEKYIVTPVMEDEEHAAAFGIKAMEIVRDTLLGMNAQQAAIYFPDIGLLAQRWGELLAAFRNFLLDLQRYHPLPEAVIHDFNRMVTKTYWLALMLKEFNGGDTGIVLRKINVIHDMLKDIIERLDKFVAGYSGR